MGTKISGICGNKETQNNSEISLNITNRNYEDVIKAKSAKKIQTKWKKGNILKLNKVNKLLEIKRRLDEVSGDRIVSVEFMRNKINPSVIKFEKTLTTFVKEPEIKYMDMCFERDPIELKDGAIYHGQWNEKGLRHGYGILIRNDGSLYEGFFNDDNLHGRGRYIEYHGNFYYEGNSIIYF